MSSSPNPKTVVINRRAGHQGRGIRLCQQGLIETEGVDTLVVDFGDDGAARAGARCHEGRGRSGGRGRHLLSRLGRAQGRGDGDHGKGPRGVVVRRLYEEGKLGGIIGMGGTGGTSIATTGMRVLPVGVPKVMVSTVAGGDVSAYAGTRDITFIPSIVDVAGINSISRAIFANAAGAIAGMVRLDRPPAGEERPLVTASMFGNTTTCVERARGVVERGGYEVLVFHATGIGGRTMESLIADGYIAGSLDLTTTEIADYVCGGVFSAGPERCEAASRAGIPTVVAPGCVDMANFRFPSRPFPIVTGVGICTSGTRMSPCSAPMSPENVRIGEILAAASQPGHGADRRAAAHEGRFDAGQRRREVLGPGGRPGLLRRHPQRPPGRHRCP